MTKNVFIPTTKGLVSATKVQTFSTEEKAQACSNIAAASVNGTYANPAWITELASTKITGTLTKLQQHAQTAYYDAAGTWAQAQTFNGLSSPTINATGSGRGSVVLNQGNSDTTGFIEFLKANGTRHWYIGFDGSNNANFTNEQSGIFTFNKGATFNGNVQIGYGSSGELKVSDTDTQSYGVVALGDGLNSGKNVGMYRGTIAGAVGSGNVLVLGGYSGITLSTGNAGFGSQTVRMTIDSAGATTFNGLVTAPNNTLIGNSDGTSILGGLTYFRPAAGGSSGALIAGNGQAWVSNLSVGGGLEAVPPTNGLLVQGAATFNGNVSSQSSEPLVGGFIARGPSGDTAWGGVIDFQSSGGTSYGKISATSGGLRFNSAATFAGPIYLSSTETHLGFNGVANYLGGYTYFRATTGGASNATIDGATGNAGFNGDITKYTTTGFDGTYDSLIRYQALADIASPNKAHEIDGTIISGTASLNVVRIRPYSGGGSGAPVTTAVFRGDLSSEFMGAVTVASAGKLGDFTVGTLPSASANAGYECNVTDSSVTTFGATAAGGGSSRVKLYSNGTNWTVQAA